MSEPVSIATVTSETKTLYTLVQSFASKRLWFTCWGVWKFTSLGLATMTVDASFSFRMFLLSTVCIGVYILSETAIQCSRKKA